jgi:hypothetical protein
MIAGFEVGPRAEPDVLGAVDGVRDIRQPDGRTIAIRDDQGQVFGGGEQLIVGVDRVRARRAVEAALGAVGIRRGDRRADRVEAQSVIGQRLRVRLDAHGGPLSTTQRDQADARHLADLLREARVDEVLHVGQRQHVRRDRERQYRRVGGIHLRVHRRRGEIGRQQRAAGVDRRLHFLLGDVQRLSERELQRDDRHAGRAGGAHPLQAGHLAEIAFQRGGDRLAHHLGTRAG